MNVRALIGSLVPFIFTGIIFVLIIDLFKYFFQITVIGIILGLVIFICHKIIKPFLPQQPRSQSPDPSKGRTFDHEE